MPLWGTGAGTAARMFETSLPSIHALAQDFWSQVWQCAHRHPCKRCCWPWREALISALLRGGAPRYASAKIRGVPQKTPAHRLAYILHHRTLLLPFVPTLPLCHQCDFPPCCNPLHLLPGTQGDNVHDWVRRGPCATRPLIVLPGGARMPPRRGWRPVCRRWHCCDQSSPRHLSCGIARLLVPGSSL